MKRIRALNRVLSNAGERRVMVTLITHMPFELDQGWSMATSAIAFESFNEITPSTLNMTRKALRGLEEKKVIKRAWSGSRKNHNEVATYFINWPPEDINDPEENDGITQLRVVR